MASGVGSAELWQLDKLDQPIFKWRSDVRFASFTSDGKVIVTIDHGGSVSEWRLEELKNRKSWGVANILGKFDALSFSADGNTLLVGAPMEDSRARGINGDEQDNSAVESGAAYLFRRTGTTWSQQAYIKAENADEFDEFGTSVAVSGDGRTLITGARMESGGAAGINGNQNDNAAPQAGAVYVWATAP
jgi:hypothetical protein